MATEGNYASGIAQIDKMLDRARDDSLAFTEETLFGAFDRYVVDSLPWTGDILKVLGEQRKVIHQSFANNA
jgi:hypothetical protein